MDERPLGIMLVLAGGVGAAVAALADPLGIGEGEVFGWLQITGVIVGAVVALLGLALAMSWMPYPGRQATTASSGTQNTTIIEDAPPPRDRADAPPRDRAP